MKKVTEVLVSAFIVVVLFASAAWAQSRTDQLLEQMLEQQQRQHEQLREEMTNTRALVGAALDNQSRRQVVAARPANKVTRMAAVEPAPVVEQAQAVDPAPSASGGESAALRIARQALAEVRRAHKRIDSLEGRIGKVSVAACGDELNPRTCLRPVRFSGIQPEDKDVGGINQLIKAGYTAEVIWLPAADESAAIARRKRVGALDYLVSFGADGREASDGELKKFPKMKDVAAFVLMTPAQKQAATPPAKP